MASSRNPLPTLTSPPPSLSFGNSLHEPPLPTLPFDVIPEILCFLPVKFLLRSRCVCKSWNSLVSDPKFAKKHFCMSAARHIYFISYKRSDTEYSFRSYPLNSVFTKRATPQDKFEYFPNNFRGKRRIMHSYGFVGSCNGILCIADDNDKGLVILLNPSIRKFKELPLLETPPSAMFGNFETTLGFGYDSFTENYKVVVVMRYKMRVGSHYRDYVYKTEVKIHTLGTNSWKSIQEFPFGVVPIGQSGKFLSGTINWLTSIDLQRESPRFIVSFDLGKESYQKVLPPDYGGVDVCHFLALGVLRDCLCLASRDDTYSVKDVWVMKEYGNRESWTKLFNVSYRGDPKYSVFGEPIYIFEDNQVLLKFPRYLNLKLIDSRNGTFTSTGFNNTPEICNESLISPCS
ncbi:putative F-box domain-containing protein [Medicago truncatula]|uniref:F-box protein interaction domain protein n=1 Tax=Medicago truncatula TaxID=3880 RepID=A0A072TVN5_MEDTR|nr:F-box/kelch-repeat protein At3g23880 [Medicago truncatula]KEH21502.1 F-box protein interaction domain protein [Medicago truncatula]RHN44039.1 putative F-box domain-containing protein [Medicago truncatula]